MNKRIIYGLKVWWYNLFSAHKIRNRYKKAIKYPISETKELDVIELLLETWE